MCIPVHHRVLCATGRAHGLEHSTQAEAAMYLARAGHYFWRTDQLLTARDGRAVPVLGTVVRVHAVRRGAQRSFLVQVVQH